MAEESCLLYAKRLFGSGWKGCGNSHWSGMELYDCGCWTTKGSTTSTTPSLVIYSGGDYGHTGIITGKEGTKYRYKDWDGLNKGDYYSELHTLDEIKALMGKNRPFYGFMW